MEHDTSLGRMVVSYTLNQTSVSSRYTLGLLKADKSYEVRVSYPASVSPI